MEFTRCLNALLMNLWGRKCSPRPTPPPSWLLPYHYIVNQLYPIENKKFKKINKRQRFTRASGTGQLLALRTFCKGGGRWWQGSGAGEPVSGCSEMHKLTASWGFWLPESALDRVVCLFYDNQHSDIYTLYQ